MEWREGKWTLNEKGIRKVSYIQIESRIRESSRSQQIYNKNIIAGFFIRSLDYTQNRLNTCLYNKLLGTMYKNSGVRRWLWTHVDTKLCSLVEDRWDCCALPNCNTLLVANFEHSVSHNKWHHSWPAFQIWQPIGQIWTIALFFFFFGYPKWRSSIGRYRKSGDHPGENLAKSDYKPDIKYKTLIILFYLWLPTQNQI